MRFYVQLDAKIGHFRDILSQPITYRGIEETKASANTEMCNRIDMQTHAERM